MRKGIAVSLLAGLLFSGCEDEGVAPVPPVPPRERAVVRCLGDRTEESDGFTRGRGHLVLSNGQQSHYEVDNLKTGSVYNVVVRYSNDSWAAPLEYVSLNINGSDLGGFFAQDTGDWGYGWGNTRESPNFKYSTGLSADHDVNVSVIGGDSYGVELSTLKMTLDD
jgi:hypothetical protein